MSQKNEPKLSQNKNEKQKWAKTKMSQKNEPKLVPKISGIQIFKIFRLRRL